MKVQISINDELMKKVDKYAAENYLTRSALCTLALNKLLAEEEALSLMKEMSIAMKKISQNGEIDEESKNLISNFDNVLNAIISNK